MINSYKRLSLFAGHYGSGKTNIAVSFAKYVNQREQKVTVADLDIVNPYFRTKDSEDELKNLGIDLIVSQFANSNLDAPALPKEIYSLICDSSTFGVLDIGGDDRGALALGRYTPYILEENNYEMYLVVNKARPLTRTATDTLAVMHEIENASGLPFTAVINNSNIGSDTTAEYVLDSMSYAEEVSEKSGLPLAFTTVKADLYHSLSDKIHDLFPVGLQKLYYQLT